MQADSEVLALWLGTAEASQEQPTPLSEKSTALKKVTQLLTELTSQLKEDKEADQKQFSEYEKLTKASITSATATVEQCTTQVAELKASIVTAEALQALDRELGGSQCLRECLETSEPWSEAEKKSLLETAASNLLQSQKASSFALRGEAPDELVFDSPARLLAGAGAGEAAAVDREGRGEEVRPPLLPIWAELQETFVKNAAQL
ncbi:unnamed protein product [Symbiodinium sp. CCMP2592]|nr:unnamed protein product [Symbiodinium sp. CCMP2592]